VPDEYGVRLAAMTIGTGLRRPAFRWPEIRVSRKALNTRLLGRCGMATDICAGVRLSHRRARYGACLSSRGLAAVSMANRQPRT
jgi:hypothetical protein